MIICGAAGRMGREISNMAKQSGDIELIAGIEASGHDLIGAQVNGVDITDDIETVIKKADCIVDFTNPAATIKNLGKNKVYKRPYVTGTTGFSKEELKKIDTIAKSFAVFLAPNMSIGVNHLYDMVDSCASKLRTYDIEVIETHHRAKKDAPSGTARAILKVIEQARPGTKFIYGREGLVGTRKQNEVCINSVRGGDIVGEHRVLFLGKGEFIELRHYATSRSCFAAGTLEAVKFIMDKGPGLYSMKDMLTKKYR
jgi:4-hydroxy-tetrahydrodipicolinate reductase